MTGGGATRSDPSNDGQHKTVDSTIVATSYTAADHFEATLMIPPEHSSCGIRRTGWYT